MASFDVARQRLYNQQLIRPTFRRPEEVVGWLGPVQAQDYLGALWAVGLRTKGATQTSIEQALADKTIVRTWPMRGTLHFVKTADVRWMLELMAPRIVAANAHRLRRDFDLDEATFALSKKVVVRILQGGKRLTREATYKSLEASGISTAGQRGLHILWRLAQDGLICFGPRKGKQHTFVLLDEWVPASKRLHRDEALGELAKRYFRSHGPATLQDFAWWSGITMADAKAGLELVKSQFIHDDVDGRTYWFSQHLRTPRYKPRTAFLLWRYDEYTVGYIDRRAAIDPKHSHFVNGAYVISNQIKVIDGRVSGTWQRVFTQGRVVIRTRPFTSLTDSEERAVAAAADRYGKFLEMPVELT